MFLLTQASKGSFNWPDSLVLLGRFFYIILAVVLVMVMAYYTTRWVAGARYVRRGKSNIKLIEGISLGYQSNVHLIKAGEKFILIGATKDNITYLTEIPKESVTEPVSELPKIPFEKYLSEFIKQKKDTDKEPLE